MASTVDVEPRAHRLSVSDYYRMADAGILGERQRVELIEGEVIDMAPIGSLHAGQVARLNHILGAGVGERAIVQVQNPVVLDAYSEPQPDLMLLRPRADFYTGGHPRPQDVFLLIEVAQSSLRYDRDRKIPLYAAHGVPEVWLADVDGGRLSVFSQPRNARYQRVLSEPPLRRMPVASLPGLVFDLGALF